MSVRRENGRWLYQKRITLPSGRKKRIKGRPATNTKAAAEAAERAHIDRELNPGARPATPEREVPTCGEYIKTFLAGHAAGNKPSEVASKNQIIDAHIRPRWEGRRLDAIRQVDVDLLKAELLAGGRSRKTVANVLAVLGSLLKYAAANGEIEKPQIRFALQVDETEMEALPDESFEALMGAAQGDVRYTAAMLLAFDAGLRIGEIRALGWGDVNEVRGQITITHALDPRGNWTPTKNRRRRVVPMTGRVQRAIGELPKRKSRTIITRLADTQHLSYSAVRDRIYDLYDAAKVDRPEKPWHALRHSFGTRLANSNPPTPLKVIQELMGHQSIETTLRYVHTTEGQKRDAIAGLGNANGPTVAPGRIENEKNRRNRN